MALRLFELPGHPNQVAAGDAGSFTVPAFTPTPLRERPHDPYIPEPCGLFPHPALRATFSRTREKVGLCGLSLRSWVGFFKPFSWWDDCMGARLQGCGR